MQEMRVWSWSWEVLCRRKWQPSPVFLCGKSHGWRSLVGFSPWGTKNQIWLNTNNKGLYSQIWLKTRDVIFNTQIIHCLFNSNKLIRGHLQNLNWKGKKCYWLQEGEKEGDGRAEGSSAIGAVRQVAISLRPDVDGSGSDSLLASILPTLLKKMIQWCLGSNVSASLKVCNLNTCM